MLARRSAMSAAEWQDYSLVIQQSLLELPIFEHAKTVALYAPHRNEVDTDLLLKQAVVLGKKVLYPKVAGAVLQFHEVKGADELREGTFGIKEPVAETISVQLESIDLFIVPGVAFDRFGRRVGYGKGYYDRTLHRLEGGGRFIGLCYDYQVVDGLAGEAHDIPVDAIVTERRVIVVPRDYHTGGSH